MTPGLETVWFQNSNLTKRETAFKLEPGFCSSRHYTVDSVAVDLAAGVGPGDEPMAGGGGAS